MSQSRDEELTLRLLKPREHRTRLLVAGRARVHEGPVTADEILRRRLIERAARQIARLETALRPQEGRSGGKYRVRERDLYDPEKV